MIIKVIERKLTVDSQSAPQDRMQPISGGMVLVAVVVFAAVAAVLGAGLHYAGSSRISQVRQELRFDRAFFTAEAGIERAKAALKNGATNNGALFGGTTNYGHGTFHASVRTNTYGTNACVVIRSTGTVESVTRVLEVAVRVIPPTPLVPGVSDGAVCFYGTNTSLYLKNANNHINGYDYDVPDNFFGNGSECDGTLTTNPAAPGVYYVDPDTDITGSGDITGNPPTTNWAGIYTEQYWYDFLDNMLDYAQNYTAPTAMGTRDNPQITLLPSGQTKITGSYDGAGILIVPGGANLCVGGTFHFEGLLIIEGDGVVDTDPEFATTGTFDMFGAVICLGGSLNMEATGRAAMKYSTSALANLSRLPIPEQKAQLDVLYWKEIKSPSGS